MNGPKKALQAGLEGLETNDLRLKEDRTIVPSALKVCFTQLTGCSNIKCQK